MRKKNIVVIGGGTGTFTVLAGLKKYPANLTAIVAMSDSGGSTGILRDELGVLPPGDVMRCLVALSRESKVMRELMDYRFDGGNLKGHKFGNLLLSALEKITGSFDRAVLTASEILRIDGTVIPVTLDPVHLMAKVGNDIIRGEETIQMTKLNGSLEHLWLEPVGRANPKAIAAIKAADAIILGPGNFYASLVPNLLVRGIPEAISKSKGKKIFICNLMTKKEHTKDFSVAEYTAMLEKYLGDSVDAVVYNNRTPSADLLKKYAREGDTVVSWKQLPRGRALIAANLLSKNQKPVSKIRTASVESSLVRHDSAQIARIVASILKIKA